MRPFEELYVTRPEISNMCCLIVCLTSYTLLHVGASLGTTLCHVVADVINVVFELLLRTCKHNCNMYVIHVCHIGSHM